jgi:hypothetical protein
LALIAVFIMLITAWARARDRSAREQLANDWKIIEAQRARENARERERVARETREREQLMSEALTPSERDYLARVYQDCLLVMLVSSKMPALLEPQNTTLREEVGDQVFDRATTPPNCPSPRMQKLVHSDYRAFLDSAKMAVVNAAAASRPDHNRKVRAELLNRYVRDIDECNEIVGRLRPVLESFALRNGIQWSEVAGAR